MSTAGRARTFLGRDGERTRVMMGTAALLKQQGMIHGQVEDDALDGRVMTMAGRAVVNFGSCSYLGLETEPSLVAAACQALQRYGTQFASSRTYVSLPLYAELEALLSRMVGGHPVVLAPTATLAHMAALPLLVAEEDVVLFDLKVHASVQALLPTLKLMGVQVMAAPHGRLDVLDARVAALTASGRRVHYLCDGVYSMHGDVLDIAALTALLDRHPRLHAYVDDSHGVGWAGRHGAGTALGAGELHERMVVVLGLSKSFAAAGGLIVTRDAATVNLIRTCGSTLIFSGPLGPAQLGAGVASARLHLSPTLTSLQGVLGDRIRQFDALALEQGLLDAQQPFSPIRFIAVGAEAEAIALGASLCAAGYYVNVAVFPAVPRGRAGIRLMLNRRHRPDDVGGIVHAISERRARSAGRHPGRSTS